MAKMKATASIDVDVRPEIVYAFLSDYENSHPKILPENHFSNYEVLKGGIGEGTLIRFRFHLMGLKRVMKAEISEPEPGRVLLETDIDTGAETSFLIEPNDDGLSTKVTIVSEWESKGIRALFERFVPARLEKVYEKELRLLKEQLTLNPVLPES